MFKYNHGEFFGYDRVGLSYGWRTDTFRRTATGILCLEMDRETEHKLPKGDSKKVVTWEAMEHLWVPGVRFPLNPPTTDEE